MPFPGEVYFVATQGGGVGGKGKRRFVILWDLGEGWVAGVSGTSTPPDKGMPGFKEWSLLWHISRGETCINVDHDTYYYVEGIEPFRADDPEFKKDPICKIPSTKTVELQWAHVEWLYTRTGGLPPIPPPPPAT